MEPLFALDVRLELLKCVKDSFPGLAQYEGLFAGGKCEIFLLFCKIGE